LDVDQHWLLQASTFPIHLATDLVFCCKVRLESKLHRFSTQFDEELVQDKDLTVKKASLVKVDVLLNFDRLFSGQPPPFAVKIELRLVELGLHILEFYAITL
jgi:hypothetical protein